jgi:hypothetical protein
LVFDQATDATPLERATIRGQPMAVHGSTVITVEPAGLPQGTASVGANVHRLRVQDNRATVEQTLDIGTGYEGHAWGNERGYVLVKPDIRSSEPLSSEVIGLRLRDDTLIETGRVSVPGTCWEVSCATDEVLLLSREIDKVMQYAIYDVSDTGLALRRILTVPPPPSYSATAPSGRPVVVSGSRVLIGAELVGGPDE